MVSLLEKLLAEQTVGDFISKNPKKLVTISNKANLAQACDVLDQTGVWSAPLIDPETKEFAGFFDYFDLAKFLLAAFKKLDAGDEEDKLYNQSLIDTLKSTHIEKIGGVAISIVADELSKHSDVAVIDPSSSMATAMIHLSSGKRRCLVMKKSKDEEKKEQNQMSQVVGIITQTDLIKFIHENKAKFKKVMKKTVSELGFCKKKILTIDWNKSAIEATKILHTHKFSALPLVDGSNLECIGSFSLKDLQYTFLVMYFGELLTPCRRYMGMMRRKQSFDHGKVLSPIIAATPQYPLSQVIDMLIATRTHRIWILKDNKPAGIAAMSDIIKAVRELG